jgi:choice-of-anchor A domain-containing protein
MAGLGNERFRTSSSVRLDSMFKTCILSLMVSALRAEDCPAQPWKFNVFALKDIGSLQSPYQADFEGSAAAVGDVYYKSFSLNVDKKGFEPYPVSVAQYTGGDLHMVGGKVAFTGVEVQGNLILNGGASIAGNANVGGNVTTDANDAGTIAGDVFCQGIYNPAVSVGGSVSQEDFKPTLDLQELASYYTNLSEFLSTIPSTIPFSIQYGKMVVDATQVSGVAALSVSASNLSSLWGIEIDGAADAGVVINIADSAVQMKSIIWSFTGGIQPCRVVLNMFNAQTLGIQGGPHQVTVLAPFAVTNFSQGLVAGNLVVESLFGDGQVNFPAQLNEIRCLPNGSSYGAPSPLPAPAPSPAPTPIPFPIFAAPSPAPAAVPASSPSPASAPPASTHTGGATKPVPDATVVSVAGTA